MGEDVPEPRPSGKVVRRRSVQKTADGRELKEVFLVRGRDRQPLRRKEDLCDVERGVYDVLDAPIEIPPKVPVRPVVGLARAQEASKVSQLRFQEDADPGEPLLFLLTGQRTGGRCKVS